MTSSGGSQAAPLTNRIPVTLKLVGDDGLSQKLGFEIVAGLRSDDRLRLAIPTDPRSIVIQTDSNVDWDILDGRKVAIVTAYVFSEHEKPFPIVRACWISDMKKCAREIIRVARKRAPTR